MIFSASSAATPFSRCRSSRKRRGLPRDGAAQCGRTVARLHDGRRRAHSRAERRAGRAALGSDRSRESGAAAAREGRRVRDRARGRSRAAADAGGGAGAEARRMIEINLLPGKKKVSKGAGVQLSMPDFKAIIAQVKDPWLIGAIAAWVIV